MLFIFRLLITLVIAITVIRSVVHFFQRLWAGTQQPSRITPRRPVPASGPVTTMLQQDPVCGTYVAVDNSLKKIVGGRVIHFCSAECRDRYPG
jgi:YHS domain-containing protein